MKQVQLIKIGGSIITDKRIPYKARLDIIRNIARKIKLISTPLIISHGSGSFGHTSAKAYGGKHGYVSLWGLAKVARDAMEINRIVMDVFIEERIPAISFRPLSFMVSNNGVLKNSFFDPIIEALTQGFIPIIYGDIIMDSQWKSTIFSGETTLNYLCQYLLKNKFSVNSILQLCDVDGVYDQNGKVIHHINKNSWPKIKKFISRQNKIDVTGGIIHKVDKAMEIAKIGINTNIINGTIPDNLISALKGERIGTVISYV